MYFMTYMFWITSTYAQCLLFALSRDHFCTSGCSQFTYVVSGSNPDETCATQTIPNSLAPIFLNTIYHKQLQAKNCTVNNSGYASLLSMITFSIPIIVGDIYYTQVKQTKNSFIKDFQPFLSQVDKSNETAMVQNI